MKALRFLAACILAAVLLAGVAWSAPVKVLIVTGETDLPYHHWTETTPYLRQVLEHTGRFAVKVIEEPRGLNSEILADYDVLVLNYNGPRWGSGPEKAVEDFVRSGKGLISFHGVTYGEFYGQVMKKRWEAPPDGDTGWSAYPKLVGATWKPENIGHGARHAYSVKWVDRNHPISRGLPPTFLANDELYHKMDLLPETHVLATAYSDPATRGTGRDEPQIWSAAYGQGRIVHLTFGHDLAALSQPGVLAAFARGTEWAATGEVTLPAEIKPPWAHKDDATRVLVVTGGHAYPAAFYSIFEGYDDIVWSHATTQAQAFRKGMSDRYDVVVLHDMYEEIGDEERANLKVFVDSGKGVVSTHHAIVDYTSWPWWYEEVIGGKYFTKATDTHAASAFKEGVEMLVTPVAKQQRHPVMLGVGPIPVEDECYRGMWQSPKITVLMETEHELNDRPVVYLGPNPDIRAVYIQLGHGEEAMRHPGYRRLVHNAMQWAAGR